MFAFLLGQLRMSLSAAAIEGPSLLWSNRTAHPPSVFAQSRRHSQIRSLEASVESFLKSRHPTVAPTPFASSRRSTVVRGPGVRDIRRPLPEGLTDLSASRAESRRRSQEGINRVLPPGDQGLMIASKPVLRLSAVDAIRAQHCALGIPAVGRGAAMTVGLVGSRTDGRVRTTGELTSIRFRRCAL